ncbi:MAG TPA: peptidylprolyl isomerase [Bacteroidales bacterium]|nr:peptidylprolyl isomerase [Bacteroidales bacterium]
MKVEKNKMVSLIYRLTENDANGTLIEETGEDRPLNFIFGVDGMIPGFENNVRDLKVEDTFAFSVNAEDGYGNYEESGVVELPITIFHKDGKLDTELCVVGNMIPMRNDEGQQLIGMIKEIKDSEILMDFNHPLAGKNLHFSGKIIGIREASEEEINQRHFHHPHEHDGSCSCGC